MEGFVSWDHHEARPGYQCSEGQQKAAFCLLLHHGTVLLAVLLLARRLNVRGKTELGVNFFYETELHGINSHRLMSHKAIPDQFG